MKKTLTLPALAAVIIIGLCNLSMSSSTSTHWGYTSFSYNNTVTSGDTLPPAPKIPKVKAPPLPKPPKPPNLFKMLGQVFQFGKRSREREKIRVITIIDSLGITDSIAASAANTQFLIDKLTDTVNQNFDSLMSLIREVKEAQKSDLDRAIEDSLRQLDLNEKYAALDNFVRVTKDKYSTTVTEKQLNVLASKIFPIISFKTEVTDVQNKMDRIRLLDRLRDSMYIVRTVLDSNNRPKSFRVLVKNKLPVYGFYTFHAGGDFNKYRFGHLNTLVYGNIVINSQDGNIRYLNGMDTSSLIERAQKQGCNVALTFTMEGDPGQNDFLRNFASQETFITTAISLAKFRNASAINISLGVIAAKMAGNFTLFIEKLSERLQREPDIQLLLTVPGITLDNNYQLTELNKFCNAVIIDFSKNHSLNAAPLASLTNIQDVVTYFMKAKIESNKLIVCLPYRGTKWAINSGFYDRYIEDINYATIRSNYPFSAYTTSYADTLVTMVMDSSNNKHVPIRRIFYDDENTLAQKFKFILDNKLGGAAVYSINDNANYTGMWDEISYAFAEPDTINVPVDPGYLPKVKRELTFFEAIAEKFALYNYILQNPCEICYENNTDTAQKNRLDQYMADFSIDSLMQVENARLLANHEDTFRSKFEYVNYQLSRLLTIITVIIFIILLALGIYYFLKMKNEGDTWRWKKITGRTLIAVAVLFVLSFFTWMFSDNVIPYFGASVSANSGYSKEYAAYANKVVSADKIMNTGYCEINKANSDCINMPLQTLLGIVIFGLLIGFLITRFLIMPLLKREDIP